MTSFPTPKFSTNASGWGPTKEPERFANVPYAAFRKSDRIGKVADFPSAAQGYNQYDRNRRRRGQESNETFDYRYDERDASTFNLVDTSKTKKTQRLANGRRNRYDKQSWRHDRDRDLRNEARKKQATQANSTRNRRYLKLMQAKRNSQRRKKWDNDAPEEIASVNVEATWKVVESFEFHKFEKLNKIPPTAEDICFCGHVEYYADQYDRVNTKKPVPLKLIEDREFYFETTLRDPVIENLTVDENVGGKVFATDAILATIMCASRSRLSWDIVCTRVGDMLFLDKREDSDFDFFTVNETSWEPPTDKDIDSINSRSKLSLEATTINQNFTQQILSGKKKEFDEPNPFFDEEEEDSVPASVGYRYRKFNLGKTPIVCRTELHGVMVRKGVEQYHTSFALNEWNSKLAGTTAWRGSLDRQSAAALANELKNNAFKIGKWTAASLLSGADQMKIGFVSRRNLNDPYKHEILGTKSYSPTKFAQQINLSRRNMWGVLEKVIEVLLKQDAGKYLLLKEPSKPCVRLYSLPEGTFSDDESSDEEESSGED
jgi:translation initiation factor 3 subunit D|eukprot:g7835.t1